MASSATDPALEHFLDTPKKGESMKRLLPLLSGVTLEELLADPARILNERVPGTVLKTAERKSLLGRCIAQRRTRPKPAAKSAGKAAKPAAKAGRPAKAAKAAPAPAPATAEDTEADVDDAPEAKRQRVEVKRIPEEQWFQHLFGFAESAKRVADPQHLGLEEGEAGAVLHGKANGKRYACGAFEATCVKDIPRHPPRKGFRFNLILGDGEDIRKVEVGAMQADPANRGATFQVASNFNCLEFVSHQDTARRGVTGYIHDHTQGPAASISAGPATVYRNYFLRHIRDGKEYRGQLDEQINLLHHCSAVPVVNGYIRFESAEDLEVLDESGFDFGDVSLAQVGRHRGVQVTFGLKDGGEVELCPRADQVVNQVFTAAMNMGDAPPAPEDWVTPVARWVLKAAYTGTVLAAIDNARTSDLPAANKLFLTLIGGGVFGNRMEWILDAILGDCKDLLEGSGLDVSLVVFSPSSISPKSLRRIKAYVDETGGRVL